MYTCLHNTEKFEQLTISKEENSFRGSIIFGFNEQLKLYKGDIKLMYESILRVNTLVDSSEYDSVFNRIIEGRQEFFSEEKYQYIEPVHPLSQEQINKYIKHRWKKPE